MRTFLHKLMATITRHPRQVVVPGIDFEWDSGNSRVWQFFRAYEYFFGRRAGVRFEGLTYGDEFGYSYRVFGTWENLFVFAEYVIREAFKGLVPKYKIIRVPAFALAMGGEMASPFRFAIAYDLAQNNSASNTTLICTVSGTNRYMFAGNGFGGGGSNNQQWSGTFNSVAMTSSPTFAWLSTVVSNGCYLAAPATGTNTLTGVQSNGALLAVTYSGVDQGTPDSYATQASANTSVLPLTFTTSNPKCWAVYIGTGTNGSFSATTNMIARLSTPGVGASTPVCGDSNGFIGTGGYTLTGSQGTGSGQSYGQFGYSFAEFTAAAIVGGFFEQMMQS